MNKFFFTISILTLCFVSIVIGQKEAVYHFPSDTAAVNILLPDYIDLTDGKKVEGKISSVNLTRKYVYERIAGTITSGGVEYNINDIAGYRYQGVYFSRADSKKHMIVRLKSGKINLYKQSMNGEKTDGNGIVEFQWIHTRHLIQKGENGDVDIFSLKLLKKYVSDYQPALDVLNYCSANKKTWQGCEELLEKAIDVYNSR